MRISGSEIECGVGRGSSGERAYTQGPVPSPRFASEVKARGGPDDFLVCVARHSAAAVRARGTTWTSTEQPTPARKDGTDSYGLPLLAGTGGPFLHARRKDTMHSSVKASAAGGRPERGRSVRSSTRWSLSYLRSHP